MSTYILIEGVPYYLGGPAEVAAAQHVLRTAGLGEAPVWASPLSPAEAEISGDPEAYVNGQMLFSRASGGKVRDDT